MKSTHRSRKVRGGTSITLISLLLTGLLTISACAGVATSEQTVAPFLTSSDYQQPSHGIQVLSANKISDRTYDLKITTPLIDDGATSGGNGFRITLPTDYQASRSYPVVYLFPGTSPDSSYTDWTEQGGAESILSGQQLIAVMPDDGKAGWYSDWTDSPDLSQNWESFHLDELLPWVDGHLKTIANRSGRAIIGASAGGYGAIHYAEDRPELFSFAASLSGPLDWGFPQIRSLIKSESKTLTGSSDAIFGQGSTTSEAQWTAHDPRTKIGALTQTTVVLYAGKGTTGNNLDDPQQLEWQLRQSSTDFAQLMFQIGNKFVNQIGESLPGCDGGHNWNCWGAALRHLMPQLAGSLALANTSGIGNP